MSAAPKMHYYRLNNPNNGYWLAEIVLLETGFFGCVSDYGDFSHAWRAFGDDFRGFVASLDEQYFATKIECGLSGIIRNGTKTHQRAIERNIAVFASMVLPVLQKAIKDEIQAESQP